MDPNTRQSKRAPVTLKIKFKSATLDQFIERYAVDVSPGGIFIRTKEPLAVGTQMRFEFQLRDATPLITGDGTVVWTRENDPTRPNAAPGMGVRFDRLGDGSQPILDRILAEKAKQPGGNAPPPAEAPKGFLEAPTRVAPSPLLGALAAEGRPPRMGQMAPARSGFVDERTDNTPLPRPMPFHSDADEFPEETFEEATKVRALDDLVAQTASPEDALAVTNPVVRAAPVSTQQPPPAPIAVAPVSVATPPAPEDQPTTPISVPTRSSQRNIALAPPPPEPAVVPIASAAAVEHTGETTPAVNAPTEQVRGPRPPTAPPVPSLLAGTPQPPPTTPVRSMPPIATPLPRPAAEPAKPAGQTSSKGVSAVVLGLLLAAIAGAAVWFFVLRDKAKPAETPPPPVASGTQQPAPVVDAAQVAEVVDAAPAVDAPPAETVAITIKANQANATVEIVETGESGPAPFEVALEKGKPFTARVTAPGMKPVELQVTGGDKTAAAKLEVMPKLIHIVSDPPGATILIDAANTRKVTPYDLVLTRAQAAQFSVRITLRKSGYLNWSKSFTPSDFRDEGEAMAASLDAVMSKAGGGGGGGGGGAGTGGGGGAGTGGGGGDRGSAGSATPAGSGADPGSGSGAGTAADPGPGSGSAAPSGGSAAPSGGSAAPSGGSAAPSGGSAAPSGGSAAPAGGSAKPAGSGSAPAGSGSAPAGSGSGKTEPTPDWMK